MIALALTAARHARDWIAETARFLSAVIEDARATRRDIEKQYGPLGF
jgi:hypothetical protein